MSLYVLDTDHVSLFQRGHVEVVRRTLARPDTQVATTVVSFEEQMRGWLNVLHRAAPQQLPSSYRLLEQALDYFSASQLLSFDDSALERYENLREQKIRIGTKDLRIAAIVLSKSAILVTRNLRDFAKIPDLLLEDWSV